MGFHLFLVLIMHMYGIFHDVAFYQGITTHHVLNLLYHCSFLLASTPPKISSLETAINTSHNGNIK